ncbi:imelysin family protein [Ferrimonas pelagia]|uniref:Imelysin-like domain-containing protein n=1 Tax=Ferrimonas pelagia TaxID=1177826 RepID=A0ABP9ELJ4_9GAMM
MNIPFSSFSPIALALTAAISLAACGGSSGGDGNDTLEPPTGFDFDASLLIDNLTDDVIVAGYQQLAAGMEALHLAADNLRNDPTQANLVAAQDAWKAARRYWEQGEAHIFGPIDALSIDPHLDSWPLNTTDLQAQLATNDSFDADSIKTWNDDVQGFHTMEFLLFGDGIADNDKAIEAMSGAELAYLVALAQVAVDYSGELEQAWTVSYNGGEAYGAALKDSGNAYYGSDLAVIEELVQGLIGIVDEVGNGKIADPFGASLAQADTSLVESQYSWNSLQDFSDNIVGVQNIYRGELSGASDKVGLNDWVRAGDEALADRLDAEIQTAIDAILAIGGTQALPFRQAILDQQGRVRVQSAVDALAALQTRLESEVIPLLSDWNN